MLANGSNGIIMVDLTQQNPNNRTGRLPYRLVLQDAVEEPNAPKKQFRWRTLVARTLRPLAR